MYLKPFDYCGVFLWAILGLAGCTELPMSSAAVVTEGAQPSAQPNPREIRSTIETLNFKPFPVSRGNTPVHVEGFFGDLSPEATGAGPLPDFPSPTYRSCRVNAGTDRQAVFNCIKDELVLQISLQRERLIKTSKLDNGISEAVEELHLFDSLFADDLRYRIKFATTRSAQNRASLKDLSNALAYLEQQVQEMFYTASYDSRLFDLRLARLVDIYDRDIRIVIGQENLAGELKANLCWLQAYSGTRVVEIERRWDQLKELNGPLGSLTINGDALGEELVTFARFNVAIFVTGESQPMAVRLYVHRGRDSKIRSYLPAFKDFTLLPLQSTISSGRVSPSLAGFPYFLPVELTPEDALEIKMEDTTSQASIDRVKLSLLGLQLSEHAARECRAM